MRTYELESVDVFAAATVKKIVLDACVIIDMLFSNRARHTQSADLTAELVARNIQCVLPMHGHFEIMSAMASEIRNKGTVKAWEGTIVSQIIPIDQSFVEKYVTGLFAELRAGDMVYLAVAAVDRLPLVTADEKLRRVALSKGVAAFSAEEFLVHLKGAGSD